jgi:hypothetical protein
MGWCRVFLEAKIIFSIQILSVLEWMVWENVLDVLVLVILTPLLIKSKSTLLFLKIASHTMILDTDLYRSSANFSCKISRIRSEETQLFCWLWVSPSKNSFSSDMMMSALTCQARSCQHFWQLVAFWASVKQWTFCFLYGFSFNFQIIFNNVSVAQTFPYLLNHLLAALAQHP